MLKKQYKKKDQISHILDRPDTYVGSTRVQEINEFVYENEKIIKKTVSVAPALIRIFVEPLSNIIDNVQTSKKEGIPCKKIIININEQDGTISMYNNGAYIPIEYFDDTKEYIHSVIFGQLLTSSNYDDTENRLVSGRNGIGIKATNVFSKYFKIEGVDPKNNKKLTQIWTNNMKNTEGAIVEESSLKAGYTEVKWIPDFKRFGVNGYSTDIINLFKKYICDTVMTTKIPIILNDNILKISNMLDYALLYTDNDNQDILYHKTKTAEVVVLSSTTGYESVSFVNGMQTNKGGKHVVSWNEAIFRPIVNKLNQKFKDSKITIKDVKKFFKIIINCEVVNPEFESQSKHELTHPNVESSFPLNKVNIIFRWDSIKNIEDMIKKKELAVLDKISKTKKVNIPGLDHANKSGGKFSKDCILILCEGDSAKTYAVSGISIGIDDKKGRDYFGIMPLRGKILNVRDAKTSTITKNTVISNMIQAIGLKPELDYKIEKNYNSLRYGKLMILCDQDVDGIHISALIINFFHYLFPTLLEKNYIMSMQTPIVRVLLPKKNIIFYNEQAFRRYVSSQKKKINVKYYKGLGTSNAREVKETFGKKLVQFKNDKNTKFSLNKVFGKDTNARKEWLSIYDPLTKKDCIGNEDGKCDVNITDYIDDKLIEFSIEDCARSIPNIFDGLKQSQRKILFTCIERNLTYNTKKTLKVLQLGGSVAEKTSYHHGENSLFDTIIKMAQAFPGSNNIPLLFRDGAFGSRNTNNDAASPRYIFTKLDYLTRLIFRPEDDNILNYLQDDGESIEPEYYIPIIPMILVNGCSGIGTGWSSNIPLYNPLNLVDCIKCWLNLDGKVLQFDDNFMISCFPELIPWYRGFTGSIEKVNANKYNCYGVIEIDNKKKIVTEIPITKGSWIEKFKEYLEILQDNKMIKKFDNYSTPNSPRFVITENENMNCSIDTLKLKSPINTTNMVLFTEDGKLKKFDTVDEIIDTFCKKRYKLYSVRKITILNTYTDKLKWVSNKRRFLEEVMNKDLIIERRDEDDVISDLLTRKYDKKENNYNYLLTLPVRNFTEQQLQKLDKEIEDLTFKIKSLENTTEKEMWLKDLDEFQDEYEKWLKIISKEE